MDRLVYGGVTFVYGCVCLDTAVAGGVFRAPSYELRLEVRNAIENSKHESRSTKSPLLGNFELFWPAVPDPCQRGGTPALRLFPAGVDMGKDQL